MRNNTRPKICVNFMRQSERIKETTLRFWFSLLLSRDAGANKRKGHGLRWMFHCPPDVWKSHVSISKIPLHAPRRVVSYAC